ncbi:MAG TPA: acyl-phosphate glycerol 3-phosphate acyltransferase [Lachnospiraceae bacterium]|jgi:glycerol-3-phosphate acyltransferase PlsY|nr:acyl-phosphate glycerol 3-phosphate acyltransferase [Lachnospiraceae bacterium]HBR04842.1 acyl-phosphate glycerol 3-phosphate acyltransferase [Lachnospiraceae bacterium]HBZ90391.1 acyl-phosphate glycerol 3-phosphate acyltransferase [Lachnospiraceae bacterium]
MAWRIILLLVIGYFCGSIPTGYLIGKIKNTDVRNYGSGNVGATNTMRTLGFKAGVITFLIDFFKSFIPVFIVQHVIYKGSDEALLFGMIMGLGCVIGHNYTCWLKFHGGKGISTTGGMIGAIRPILIPVFLLIFFGTLAITKYVSFSSLVLITSFVVYIGISQRNSKHFVLILIMALVFAALAFFKHRENIKRLLNGTEKKIGKEMIHGSKDPKSK